MSLLPTGTARLPSALVTVRVAGHLQAQSQELARLQDQLATGQQFFLPSHAPAAATKTIVLQSLLERQDQLESNIRTSRASLSTADATLAEVNNVLNRATSLLQAGVGTQVSEAERLGLAEETDALLRQLVSLANAKFQGRSLFGGSTTDSHPFVDLGNGKIAYLGDRLDSQTVVDRGVLIETARSGVDVFGGQTAPIGGDLNPALTLATRLSDLNAGRGVDLGEIEVTLDNGGTPQTAVVDLTDAVTIDDVKVRLEDAFAGGPLTLSVTIDAGSQSALELTASSGTVEVVDPVGSRMATELGIAGGPAATLTGLDTDPAITKATRLDSLHGGTGIDATQGGSTSFVITNGSVTRTIDLTGAETVEDLINRLDDPDLHLDIAINSGANGLSVSSQLSGATLTIGEDNGTNATDLGLRTLTGSTNLDDLNLGLGVPRDNVTEFEIERRDGTIVTVDVTTADTVQDVLDTINSIDPGVLVADFAGVGNGITIVDGSGVGDLVVENNVVSEALGIAGSETSGNPANAIHGEDVHQREPGGTFQLLVSLRDALNVGDDRELARLDGVLDREVDRFHAVRAEFGTALRTLDAMEARVLDRNVTMQESLSLEFDTDFTQVITQVTRVQQALQATMHVAGTTLQLSLFSFL